MSARFSPILAPNGRPFVVTGTPEPSSGQPVMPPDELARLFADPRAQRALAEMENSRGGYETGIGHMLRTLARDTPQEINQRIAHQRFLKKVAENKALYRKDIEKERIA